MISLAGVLAEFSAPITVIRTAPDTFAGGVRTRGATNNTASTGSVQPATPNEIQRLPEGSRTREAKLVFSPFALRSADDRTGTVADRVQLADGSMWEVGAVDDWSIAGFFKATILRVEGI